LTTEPKPEKPSDSLFVFCWKVFLVLAVTSIPWFLFNGIENTFTDPNILTMNDFGNSTWHQSNPHATFADYKQSYHDKVTSMLPTMQIVTYVFMALIGGPVGYTLLKDDFKDNKKERYDSSGKRTQ